MRTIWQNAFMESEKIDVISGNNRYFIRKADIGCTKEWVREYTNVIEVVSSFW